MLMRSKLFVPGSRPELFAKAAASAADAVSFDLEDSVPAARKSEARDNLASYLRDAANVLGKTIVVRVNAVGTDHFAADVAAVAGGTILVDGQMIDAPFLARARATMALAEHHAGPEPEI